MLYRFLPIVTVVLTLLATAWISLLPLNWFSQADISNKYATLVTPAGFTFSIWSLIYITWLAVGIMIAAKYIEVGKKLKVVFSLSVALTGFWLIPWHNEKIFVSLVVMLMIFAGFSYLFLHTRKKETPTLFKYTVELTYGWIIAATLLNIFVFMEAMGTIQDPQNSIYIALLGLFVWTMIQIAFLNGFKAFVPVFVFIWALWGIYNNQPHISIRLAALLFSIILLVNYIYIRKKAYEKCLVQSCDMWEAKKEVKKGAKTKVTQSTKKRK
jgi:translocator protein